MQLPFDQCNMEALEIIDFNELIQIHAKAFESNAQVISEGKAICHFNIMMSVLGILLN